jgi:hypothetical protein
VCCALSIANTTDALKRLDEDERALDSIEGISRGNDQVNLVNESGLYSLILGSRKPEARRFKKWVTSEVLPAIRKTGGYQQPAAQEHLLRCWELANSLASTAQHALFDTLMKFGEQDLRFERLLVTFGHDMVPRVERVQRHAVVATLGDLVGMIDESHGVYASDGDLAQLARACSGRLAQRIGARDSKAEQTAPSQ